MKAVKVAPAITQYGDDRKDNAISADFTVTPFIQATCGSERKPTKQTNPQASNSARLQGQQHTASI